MAEGMQKLKIGDKVECHDCGITFLGVVAGYTENVFGRPLVQVKMDDDYASVLVFYESEVKKLN